MESICNMFKIKLSVIIVNYKVRDLLAQTIRSVTAADGFENCEIIVVDNNSQDGSKELIEAEFKFVKYIESDKNLGFGKACNVGAAKAEGEFILMLNPDTIISKNTLSFGIDYLEKHKNVGILGPKILNQDGSFQYQCRRSFPTPLNAFAYMSGLSKIFAKNKTFGQYNLSYIPVDEECNPDAVSGACFFISKEIFLQTGGFDEQFFMYGEDLDLCAKVKSAGFEVKYSPQTQIIHFKGRSSVQQKMKSRVNFYNAMILFSQKYKNSYGSFFPNWLLSLVIRLIGGLNILSLTLKNSPVFFADLICANAFIPPAAYIHSVVFHTEFTYFAQTEYVLYSHFILTVIFLAGLYITKHYGSPKPKIAVTQRVASLSVLLIFAVYYALHQEIGYSRIIVFSSAILSAVSLVFWRSLISPLSKFYKKYFTGYGDVVLLAQEPYLSALTKKLQAQNNTKIIANIEARDLDGIKTKFHGVNSLIIGSKENWYPTIIKLLSEKKLKGVSIFWLPPESKAEENCELKSFMGN